LARDGKQAWANLLHQFGETTQAAKLTNQVSDSIKLHKPHNCYEQRYDHWLLACFAGDCGKAPNTEIGGACN
jgi:hypothetical protein